MLATNLKTTDTRFGRMSYYATDYYIGKSLELYGEYSWGEIELLAKFVKPDWTVINGGANIGSLTMPIADLVPKGKVYAFEPQPEVYQVLKRNARRRKNVVTSDYALWRSAGDTKMRLLAEVDHGNLGGLVIGDEKGTHTARMIALDDWLKGEDVNLIFLDIEGCETGALEGASETIKRCRPVLYVEYHAGYRARPDVVSFVRGLDYLTYMHQPPLYSKDNWKKCPENAWPNVASFNVLCIPKERLDEFRHVVEDQTKFYYDNPGNKLKMFVPLAPSQGASGWAGIARCGGVGDNLISGAVCKSLKELGYKVEVITQAPQNVVFENNPYIDKISVYEAKDWPADLGQWQHWFRMRAREYEKFANLSHSVEALHGLLPIQTWYWWPEEMRRKMCGGSYLETPFHVLGLPVPKTFGPLFFPTDEEKEQALATKRKLGDGPVVAFTLSGTRIDKVYPYTSLLIARLIKELGARVVMLGAPPPYRDYEIAKTIMEHVKVQNGSLDGLTHAASPSMEQQVWPIRRILTFAAACDLVIGPDTGPSWGVALEPVPKIIMVSHASVENITKHWRNTLTLHAGEGVTCWPCHRLHDSFEQNTCNSIKINNGEFAKCISDISVETIITNAARLLRGEQNG
jgi:FkbM family methyltransferase